MKILLSFLFLFLFSYTFSQRKLVENNAFDKRTTITYCVEGYKLLVYPVTIIVGMPISPTKDDDTTFYIGLSQTIDRSDYINFSDGKVDKLEVMKSNGELIEIDKLYLENSYYKGSSSTYSYSCSAYITLTPDLFQYFIDMKGYRINGINEGFIFKFGKKDQDLHKNLVNLFLNDFPQFNLQ